MKRIMIMFFLFIPLMAFATDTGEPETPLDAAQITESPLPAPNSEAPDSEIVPELPCADSKDLPCSPLNTDETDLTEDDIEIGTEIAEKPHETIDSQGPQNPEVTQTAASPELLSLEDFVIIPPRSNEGIFIWRVTIKNNNASPLKKDISIRGSQLSRGKWHPAGKVTISKLKGGQKKVALTNWSRLPDASELKIIIFHESKDYASLQKAITDLMP